MNFSWKVAPIWVRGVFAIHSFRPEVSCRVFDAFITNLVLVGFNDNLLEQNQSYNLLTSSFAFLNNFAKFESARYSDVSSANDRILQSDAKQMSFTYNKTAMVRGLTLGARHI